MKDFKVAFTGHRPDKLYGFDMNIYPYLKLEMKIEHTIEWLIQMWNAKEFYTGGALGFDTIVAKTLIELRNSGEYPYIQDYVCVPFKEQYKAWSKEQAQQWLYIVNNCYKPFAVDTIEGYECKDVPVGKYHPSKMQLRNQYMVDNCDILVACWNGEQKGGTYNCIKYATNKEKKILIINPQTLETDKTYF